MTWIPYLEPQPLLTPRAWRALALAVVLIAVLILAACAHTPCGARILNAEGKFNLCGDDWCPEVKRCIEESAAPNL